MPTSTQRRALAALCGLLLALTACQAAQDHSPAAEPDASQAQDTDTAPDLSTPQDMGPQDGEPDQAALADASEDMGAGPDAPAPGDLPTDAAPDLPPVEDLPTDAAPDAPEDLPAPQDMAPQDALPDLEAWADAQVPRRWPAPMEEAATHDVDRDLARVLERENLEGACQALEQGQEDRATRLRCGKWMFFYEHFDTVGIPRDLLIFLQKYYADSFYGRGFSELGFVPDPDSPEGLPLGLVTSSRRLGNLETSAFTCASCHFGQMADGRYAVGYANQSLDYGRLIATLGAPLTLSGNAEDPSVHPDIREMLREPVRQAKMQPLYTLDLGLVGVSLLIHAGDSQPQLDLAAQEAFWVLDTGTMDFLTSPLVEDNVWTVSRTLSLWNLPGPELRQQHQMEHAMLSWTGVVDSLLRFLQGFVLIGDGEQAQAWTEARLAPLAEYVMSLRAPAQESPLDPDQVEAGARLFAYHGCVGCHDGPSGEGSQLYTYEELEVDDALSRIYDPDPEGNLCCGFGEGGLMATFRVKAPRMNGVENQRRFLHNGGVHSLEQLFCLEPRRQDAPFAQGSQGHWMTCEGLGEPEKRALISYLRSL